MAHRIARRIRRRPFVAVRQFTIDALWKSPQGLLASRLNQLPIPLIELLGGRGRYGFSTNLFDACLEGRDLSFSDSERRRGCWFPLGHW